MRGKGGGGLSLGREGGRERETVEGSEKERKKERKDSHSSQTTNLNLYPTTPQRFRDDVLQIHRRLVFGLVQFLVALGAAAGYLGFGTLFLDNWQKVRRE